MDRTSRFQSDRRRDASRISKRWDIKGRSRRSRGLANPGNACYRNGSLQPLLHLPRFVNWIKQHRSGRGNWPCNQENPDHSLASLDPMTQSILSDESYKNLTLAQRAAYDKNPNGGTIENEDLEKHDVKHYSGCLPCLLKAFFKDYWSRKNTDPIAPYNPNPFPYAHDSVFKLHQLLQRYFCHDPPGHSDAIEELLETTPSMPQAQIDRMTRAARRQNMSAQQDADELMRRIWDGIEASFNPATEDGQLRQNQFNALFRLARTTRHTCAACRHSHIQGSEDSIGLTVTPLDEGNDTVSDAIARVLYHEFTPGITCAHCASPLTYEVDSTLDATPEYLRIYVQLAQAQLILDEDGNEILDEFGYPQAMAGKSQNSIVVDDILTLTDHMTQPYEPVTYKLHSATYHQGMDINAGHYTAGVTQPRGPGKKNPAIATQFFVDDAHVIDWHGTPERPNVLTENPVGSDGGRFDVMVLWYEIIPHVPKIEGKLKKVRQSADELAIKEGEAIRVEMLRKMMEKGIHGSRRRGL